MTNKVNYDSYFQETTTDNNGVAVCDINAGLNNLYAFFNDEYTSFFPVQKYFIPEHEEGYPDLVAAQSAYGNQAYWWWVLFLNRQDDAFEGLKANWVYSINGTSQVGSFIQKSTTSSEASGNKRVGTIIELN